MLTKVHELTRTQDKVHKLLVIGKSYKEIADILDKPLETIKSHIRDLKQKTPYQKQSEMIANFWCEYFGVSFEEKRMQIISSCLTIAIVITFQINYTDKNKRPEQRRMSRIEAKSSRRTEYACAT